MPGGTSARAEAEELRGRTTQLAERLAQVEERLSRLVIAREVVDEVLAGLADHDLERRRRAARQLACHAWGFAKTAPPGLLDDAAGRFLSDTDPLLRLNGIAVARGPRLARLFPRLRELEKTETDPWVRHHLTGACPEPVPRSRGKPCAAAAPCWL